MRLSQFASAVRLLPAVAALTAPEFGGALHVLVLVVPVSDLGTETSSPDQNGHQHRGEDHIAARLVVRKPPEQRYRSLLAGQDRRTRAKGLISECLRMMLLT